LRAGYSGEGERGKAAVMIPPRTYAAGRVFDKARHDLSVAVQADFPLDARVAVTIGLHRIKGTVSRYGQEWSEPSYVYLTNDVTGKVRKFSALDEDLDAVVLS
jgi:hypothetical protein